MDQKKLIVFITLLFVLCSGYLFYVSGQGLRSDEGKNWWALYFEDPKSADLDFVIENHSDKENFHWEIKAANQKISEGDVEIKTGESKNIQPGINTASGKNSISVSGGGDKKDIYKNLK